MTARPTLLDVARRAGFSKAAVSMALRNSLEIPAATRALIGQAARDVGYRSDPMLAALSSRRWHRRPAPSGSTLAALADGKLEGVDGMAERAAAYGYHFEIFQVADYPHPKRLAHVLYSRGILGVVVGQLFTPGFCTAFDWSKFVIVACCEGYERPPVHLIMPNHFRAVQEGWDHAWTAGYRRIGLALIHQPEALDYHDRCAAFLDRQQRAGPSDRLPVLAIEPQRRPDQQPPDPAAHAAGDALNLATMDAWLRQHRPDVVLGFSNYVLRMLRLAGWRVPQQMPFISLWNHEEDSSVSGLALTLDEVGRRAVEWLDSLLRSGERGLPRHPATMSIDMVWQAGKTTRRPVRRRTPGGG